MSQRYQDIIERWEDAGSSDEASLAIHPTGGRPLDYERSGFEAALEVMSILNPHTHPDGTVLDFGCGDGRVLRHLGGRYDHTAGYDTSESMRSRAHHTCRRALILDELNGSHERFDLVFSYAVFIHHTHTDGVQMLNSIAKLLVRGTGLAAVQIPVYDEARAPQSWIDVGVWTPPMLHEAADACGLEVVTLHRNLGAFSFDNIGVHHGRLQVFRRNS